MRLFPVFSVLVLLAPVAAVAQSPDGKPDLIFKLRGGAAVSPDYFGSEDYTVGPDLSLGFGYLRFAGREFGSTDPDYERRGLGLRGSFRYIGERSASDHPELAGLEDVDASLELGMGLGYYADNFEAFADLRYGVVGHESFVGEVGADLVMRPTDRLKVTAGPRFQWGSDKFNSTYFDVTPAEAAASGGALSAYDADGGLVSGGIELGASYELNDNWDLEGAVTWDRLTDDAADSPITQQGDRDQYGVRIGITRRITLDF